MTREDQIYKENKGITRLTGVRLRKLEQRYVKEQRDRKVVHGTIALMVIKQYLLYSNGELPTNNDKKNASCSVRKNK